MDAISHNRFSVCDTGVNGGVPVAVLVAVSSRVDQLLAPILYKLTFDNAVYVGSDRASIQALADLNGLRQFITGNGIFAFFDAPWIPITSLLFMFHPLLGWMGVFAALLFFALAVANQAATNDALAKANEVQRMSMADTQKIFATRRPPPQWGCCQSYNADGGEIRTKSWNNKN